ncbi:MAG: nucleotidyltransferase [Nitrosomonadales bacterium]|nr:nucleotidyltransferase [Nitrosomonadales bacterium]
MKPTEIFKSQREFIRRVVESHRHHNPRLFAFVLYGEDLGENDLDLLVENLPGATLQDLGAIQAELEKKLGIPVEVITPADLPSKFRDRVLREAIAV